MKGNASEVLLDSTSEEKDLGIWKSDKLKFKNNTYLPKLIKLYMGTEFILNLPIKTTSNNEELAIYLLQTPYWASGDNKLGL